MKQIIIFFLFLIFSSCASHRTIQQEKIREKVKIDSTFQHVLTNKNIEIEWIFSDDSTTVPYQPGRNNTAAKPRKKYTPQKIPRFGKIRIHISNDSITAKGKVEAATKIKAKTKKKTKIKKKEPSKVLKPKKAKSRFNFIYVILIGFCVKFLWDNKNTFQKLRRIIK